MIATKYGHPPPQKNKYWLTEDSVNWQTNSNKCNMTSMDDHPPSFVNLLCKLELVDGWIIRLKLEKHS